MHQNRPSPFASDIFTADEGVAGNSAARTIFTHFLRRRNRGSLAILFATEIAHLGASKNRAIFWGAVKKAAAAAENRAILVHSGAVWTPLSLSRRRFACLGKSTLKMDCVECHNDILCSAVHL